VDTGKKVSVTEKKPLEWEVFSEKQAGTLFSLFSSASQRLFLIGALTELLAQIYWPSPKNSYHDLSL
jgi:hypothetical protein